MRTTPRPKPALFGELSRQAERMTSRVKEHAPPIRCWLLVDTLSPEANSFGLSFVQVVRSKVEVDLFREAATRP